MPASPLDGVVQYLRTVVGRQHRKTQPDTVLLRQFVGRGDDAAFAALVERHGPMVLSICRRIVHEELLADDAFQATFLVLARKANPIRKRQSLASWLHGVALRLARRVKSPPSLEAEQRMRELLDKAEKPWSPSTMQQMRALKVLEMMGTQPARRLLQQWASGAAGARLTVEAKAALERLGKRKGE